MIKKMISDMIKRWGVKLVLRELISVLEKSHDENLVELARDLYDALKKYEKRSDK